MQQNNGLDKNQLISFVVFTAMLVAFMFYFQNKQAQQRASEAQAKTSKAKVSETISAASGIAAVAPASIKTVQLKNEGISLGFSTLGGQISSAKLNQYFAYNPKTDRHDLPLYLIHQNNSNFGFQFKDKTGKIFNTKDLVFVPKVSGNVVTMTAQVQGANIQFIYTLLDQYTVDFRVKTQGLSSVVTDGNANFNWNYAVRGMEKGRSQEQTHSEFNYAFQNYQNTDYDTNGFEEPEETLNWIGVKQQFFTTVVESETGFVSSQGTQESIEKGEFLKKFNFEGQVKLSGNELTQNFKWYFLPLNLSLLEQYEDKKMDTILPLGWSFIGSLNRYFLYPYTMLFQHGVLRQAGSSFY